VPIERISALIVGMTGGHRAGDRAAGMGFALGAGDKKKSQPFPSSPRDPARKSGVLWFIRAKSRAEGLGYDAAVPQRWEVHRWPPDIA